MALITEIQTTSDSGNIFIDSLTFDQAYVPGTVITYILQGNAGDTGAFGGAVWAAEGRRAAFNLALQSWAAVANVVFQEASGTYVAGSTAYDWVENFGSLGAGVLGQHELPGIGTITGTYSLASGIYAAANLGVGGYGLSAFVHEIGHGLGLLHPHNDGGESAGDPTFPGVTTPSSLGTYGLNQGVFTAMSYLNGYEEVGLSQSDSYGWVAGPMAFDIAAIQRIYGANLATHAGNDSYTLVQQNAAGTAWTCLWDASGTDVLSAGDTLFDAWIDLRAATLQPEPGGGGFVSRIAGVLGGFTIANGVTIEIAKGGGGDDVLHGNAANNVLDGGSGLDTVSYAGVLGPVQINLANGTATGDGTDTLLSIENAVGGDGNDTLSARTGAVTAPAATVLYRQPGWGYLDLDYHFANLAGDPSIQSLAGQSSVHVHVTHSSSSDNFGFWLQNPGTIVIDVDNSFGLDTVVTVYSANRTVLGSNDDGGQLDPGSANVFDSLLSLDIPQGNQYIFIEVTSANGGEGTFDLNVSLATSRLATNDVLLGSRLFGGGGDDTLIGGTGIDYLDGGEGDDVYYNIDANDVIADSGQFYTPNGIGDTIVVDQTYTMTYSLPLENATLSTIAGNADLTGTYLSNRLQGNDGNNIIHGIDGWDIISGGAGDDQLYFDRGAGFMDGGPGNDLLVGGNYASTFDGGTGDDSYIGTFWADIYYVDSSNDVIFETPSSSSDHVISTSNYYLFQYIDRLTLQSGAGDIFGVGNERANIIAGNEGANLLLGGAGNDSISGGAGNDSLYGEVGADWINGESGIDYISGGDGNDRLGGGSGADAIYGGAGDDTLFGDTAPNPDPYSGASVGSSPSPSFETDILVGGDGNDILYANSGLGDYDILNGGAGNDTYYVDTPDDIIYEGAGEGTDTVYAGITGAGYYLWANVENCTLTGNTPFAAGNEIDNVLTGSAATNWLLGNGGNDTLNGKGGNDVLFGDRPGDPAGNDTFVFDGVVGQDVIGDFHHGEDKIRLVGGYASFEQVQAAFHQNGSDGAIDLGGGNFIVLLGVTMSTLTASDFIFG